MSPATWPRSEPAEDRLLLVDRGAETFSDRRLGDVPSLLRPGDLLVVNDAATLPASLPCTTERGEPVELRLAGRDAGETFRAVAFGAGDWRTRTEDRPAPPALAPGTRLRIAADLSATILTVEAARVVMLRFDRTGAALWQALYASGRPIQYAYVEQPLALWHVQTPFASRPWAFELPSAGRPLTWEILGNLLARGIEIASVTHSAGISSTGSAELDRALPFREGFEIPERTARLVTERRAAGGRVVAVGTTVVRALEASSLRHGAPVAGRADTDLIIGPGFKPRTCDALLTGIHAANTSHFAVMAAFASRRLLERALEHADRVGYLEHEFGDSCLVVDHPEG